MNYLSFTFKLDEKKVSFKKYGSDAGGYKKLLIGRVFQNLRGVGNIWKKWGLDKKGWSFALIAKRHRWDPDLFALN